MHNGGMSINFRDARLRMGLTQQRLASLLDMSLSQVARLDRGEGVVRPIVLKFLERLLAEYAAAGR